MLGSEILEVAIGLIFIYILVSVTCSAIREGVEAWLKTRAAYLEYGIRELLHDKLGSGLAKSFYNHPLIFSLFAEAYTPGDYSKRPGLLAKGANLPSYIPTKNFALALMDIAARGPDTDAVSSAPNAPVVSLDTIRMNVANLKNQAVQRMLLTAIDSAQGDLNRAQASLEAWYDGTMDRVSGWYKRSTQWVIFWVGLVVAVLLNINSITIADYLYRNDAARAVLVARAETVSKNEDFLKRSYDELKKELDTLNLPIGWGAGWGIPKRMNESQAVASQLEMFLDTTNNVLITILGWLLTAFAATMGAPFWFDVLNKVMVIRSTVKPPAKSPEEASEDRQLPIGKVIGAIREGQDSTQGTVGAATARTRTQASLMSLRSNQWQNASTPRDDESGIDGCDVDIDVKDQTSDENLPAAEGGVTLK